GILHADATFERVRGGLAGTAVAQVPTTTCEAMLSVNIPDTEINSATVIAATATRPAHCDVVAVTHGEPGSTVGVEVRLPDGWNGKLLFTTKQGFLGSLAPLGNPAIADALGRHYATVTTDGGHSNPSILDASFGLNNRPAEVDFGYRAVHLAKVVAATLIYQYYGSEPVHSYYNGCSTSGRLALQAGEHYPDDFDGIIAGDPVLDMTGLTIGFNWDMQATLANPIPKEKLSVVYNAVMNACDALDGLEDGLIDDPSACHFDLSTLACAEGQDPTTCLTAGEIGAFEKIYAGPSRSATAPEDPGEQIYPGFAFGGELPDGKQGWDVYVTAPTPLQLVLQDQYLRYLAFDPDDPNFDWRTFDFDTDPQRMQTMHQIIDAVQDDLTAFSDAGGKMIIYQGWGDIAQSPYRTIEYYKGLRRHVGRRPVENFARLFMAPGMYHCGGGVGPNTFDALTALERWVEQGQAPSFILASHTQAPGVDRTRPLCPFPQRAVYKGSGSIYDAASFTCGGPPIGTAVTGSLNLFDTTAKPRETAGKGQFPGLFTNFAGSNFNKQR
ncbi:MAG: tannase/feruloyl esterase family alpha/beta hydrolase, partial [Bacteroidales bacterium]